MVELRENERKTLLAVERLGGKASVEQIMEESGLPDSALMRAAITLQERKLVRVSAKQLTIAGLTEEGKDYSRNGLPERRMMNVLEELGGRARVDDVAKKARLDRRFIPIALGWLRTKKWAHLDAQTRMLQVLRNAEEGDDDKMLKLLRGKEQVVVEDLGPELQEAVQILKRRKLLDVTSRTRRIIEITQDGWTRIQQGVETTAEVTQLTPELIITGKWRDVKLQKYAVEAPVAKTWPGKKHPYLSFLDEVKSKLVTLGFKEMTGPTVETSFFNFDALYMPQDHPAREIFGIYQLKTPMYGGLDVGERVIQSVKKTHENGWKTGSTGWRYKYSIREAKRLILRGHGTCQSTRMLLNDGLEVPGKYFSIVRCYRPEVLDKIHLTEFNQVEGIIVDEKLTLRDLLGVLEKFAVDIAGADEVKFKPDYFPFTEPSVELSAYKKDYGWIEFGGSGIFRPEVTLPLGIKVPVIAWGLGVDRLYMLRAKIDDIRQLFSQDLDWIRRKEMV